MILRRDVRKQAPGAFTTLTSDTGSAATSYIDISVSAGTKYAFWIKAIDSASTSDWSGYVNATTLDGLLAKAHHEEPKPERPPNRSPFPFPSLRL